MSMTLSTRCFDTSTQADPFSHRLATIQIQVFLGLLWRTHDQQKSYKIRCKDLQYNAGLDVRYHFVMFKSIRQPLQMPEHGLRGP